MQALYRSSIVENHFEIKVFRMKALGILKLGLAALILLGAMASDPALAQIRPDSKFIKAIREKDYASSYSYLVNGGNPNARDYDGVPALFVAADLLDRSMVSELLKRGGNPDIRDRVSGETPLIRAAARGGAFVVELILAYEAQIDIEDGNGATALIKAVQGGHLNVVKLLLENNADIEFADYAGLSAYDHARTSRDKRILKVIEEHAAKN